MTRIRRYELIEELGAGGMGRAAPRHGRVSVELDEALRLVGLVGPHA